MSSIMQRHISLPWNSKAARGKGKNEKLLESHSCALQARVLHCCFLANLLCFHIRVLSCN